MEIKELVRRSEITDIRCDACGNTCLKGGSWEYVNISRLWGYGSDKDGITYECDLCEACFDKVWAFIKTDLNAKVREEDKYRFEEKN